MLAAQLRDRHTACFRIAMICTSLNRPFYIVNLLRYLAGKILLLNTMDSAGHCNSCSSLRAGVRDPKVFRGRLFR